MSNISKFHYLKSSVTDNVASANAALLINGLQISPENYTTAWKMLVTEYDDKRVLIHTHLQSFVCLPKGKSETANELKKLCDRRARSVVESGMSCQLLGPYLLLQRNLAQKHEWNGI